ncbi:hypothetical protein ACSMXN_05635 [Jatrophihabitans sp. DSM 45814]
MPERFEHTPTELGHRTQPDHYGPGEYVNGFWSYRTDVEVTTIESDDLAPYLSRHVYDGDTGEVVTVTDDIVLGSGECAMKVDQARILGLALLRLCDIAEGKA